jgi:hypothetical protein
MPLYKFKNKTTDEIYSKYMSHSSMLEYIKDLNIEQIFSVNMISGVNNKPDQGFRDVLKKVKSAHYKSTIDTF